MPSSDNLRYAFASICDGYSCGTIYNEPCYIKHLGYREHLNLETIQEQYKKQAIDAGLPTNDQQLKKIMERGLWGPQQEHEIATQKDSIERFKDAKQKAMLPSMLKQYDDEIRKQQDKLTALYLKKAELMGLTVETHAEKLINDYYILKNIYIDSEFSQPLFDEEEFDELNDSEISDIISDYNDIISVCSEDNIKKLSVQDFFQEYFFICGDDLSSFFGKSIVTFTYFQIRLGNYAKYFKNIFENNDLSKLPKDRRHDPEAIESFISTTKNAQSVLDKQKGGTVGLVGATKEDIRALGLEGSVKSLPNKEMNKEQLFDYFEKK